MMPQLNIYIDEKEDANLEAYMKSNGIRSKLDAIRRILRELDSKK